MPAVALVTIALGAVLALALVGAVGVIVMQLLRTSAVLADIDALLARVPPGLAGLGPTVSRINVALKRLVPAR